MDHWKQCTHSERLAFIYIMGLSLVEENITYTTLHAVSLSWYLFASDYTYFPENIEFKLLCKTNFHSSTTGLHIERKRAMWSMLFVIVLGPCDMEEIWIPQLLLVLNFISPAY